MSKPSHTSPSRKLCKFLPPENFRDLPERDGQQEPVSWEGKSSHHTTIPALPLNHALGELGLGEGHRTLVSASWINRPCSWATMSNLSWSF